MPEHLTWFKYESYFTWLSGFLMLCIVYYRGANLFLIDRHVLDVSVPVAILISLASLAGGWIVYDLLCKSPLGNNTLGSDGGALCRPRLHGAGAIPTSSRAAPPSCISAPSRRRSLSANVFMIIIPNQKIVVADLIAGRTRTRNMAASPSNALFAQQLSNAARYLLHAVEPLSAGLRHRL